MCRAAAGASPSISTNSQNWRLDPGGAWQRGRDIGYGYGRKLQAGALTPVYSTYYTIDNYLFVDEYLVLVVADAEKEITIVDSLPIVIPLAKQTISVDLRGKSGTLSRRALGLLSEKERGCLHARSRGRGRGRTDRSQP